MRARLAAETAAEDAAAESRRRLDDILVGDQGAG